MAALLLRCADKQLWRRIEFYVQQARALEVFADVQIVGVDETRLRRGQNTPEFIATGVTATSRAL